MQILCWSYLDHSHPVFGLGNSISISPLGVNKKANVDGLYLSPENNPHILSELPPLIILQNVRSPDRTTSIPHKLKPEELVSETSAVSFKNSSHFRLNSSSVIMPFSFSSLSFSNSSAVIIFYTSNYKFFSI